MTDTTDLRVAACNFRGSARSVRPHPANPHVVRAGDVAHFVDTDCAVIAQRVDEAADTLDAKDRTIAGLREALVAAEHEIVTWRSGQLPDGPIPDVKAVTAFKVIGAARSDFVPPAPTGKPDTLALIREALKGQTP